MHAGNMQCLTAMAITCLSICCEERPHKYKLAQDAGPHYTPCQLDCHCHSQCNLVINSAPRTKGIEVKAAAWAMHFPTCHNKYLAVYL